MYKYFFATALFLLTACGNAATSGNKAAENNETAPDATAATPVFDADSAYTRIAEQVAFGPRVPGSEAHRKCENYIFETLRRYGADTITVQRGQVTAFDKTNLPVANIMASFNSKAPRRILMVAHYDTRPFADQETDESKRNTPIDGANDGGSGVGVLLEIARLIGQNAPGIGVDFLFTDVEDYGAPDDDGLGESTWCLGTQYWAANSPYTPENRPSYGIVLDMVGGSGAKFPREIASNKMAPSIVDRVWGIAAASEYADRFPNNPGGAIIDDHYYVNAAGIPCIDVIESTNSTTGGFPPTWHTHNDNMDHIDRSTLKAVGQVMLNVIYSEPAN